MHARAGDVWMPAKRHVAIAILVSASLAGLLLASTAARTEIVAGILEYDTVRGGEGTVTYRFLALNNTYSFTSNRDVSLTLLTSLGTRDRNITFSMNLTSPVSMMVHNLEYGGTFDSWEEEQESGGIVTRLTQLWGAYVFVYFGGAFTSFTVAMPAPEKDNTTTSSSWARYNANGSWSLLDTVEGNGTVATTITPPGQSFFLSVFQVQRIPVEDPVDPDPVDPDPVDPDPVDEDPDLVQPGLFAQRLLATTTMLAVVAIVAAVAISMGRKSYQEHVKRQFTSSGAPAKHSLTIDEVFENENRNRIIDLVLERPGIHFNELLRETGLAPGNLVWHLEILQNYSVIGKKSVGQYVVYFPFYTTNPLSNINLELAKSKTTMDILKRIEDEPGIYANIIAKALSLDHKTVKYHVGKLTEKGLVTVKKAGRTNRLFPAVGNEDLEGPAPPGDPGQA